MHQFMMDGALKAKSQPLWAFGCSVCQVGQGETNNINTVHNSLAVYVQYQRQQTCGDARFV